MATGFLPNNIFNDPQFKELVSNVMSLRSEMFSKLFDPRRNIDDECGYPSGWVDAREYQALYDREALAHRVVEVMPRESWQVLPSVYEDEAADITTPFEAAWDGLGGQLRGEGNYCHGGAGSLIWEYLQRVDILSGIGQYGVLLIGLDDGAELSQPVQPGQAALHLLFLRCFPESLSPVVQFDANPRSPRFGQPVLYSITLNDPDVLHGGGIGLSTATVNVHWTRVIHVADNRTTSEVFGVPRIRPVLRRLLDLQKLYCGSAEMYWRGAFPGYTVESHPQLGGDVIYDETRMKETFENWMNGLQRIMALSGWSMKSLAPQVVDPTAQINAQIEAICIHLGIPKRIFMGSERGELASSQDDAAWNDRLKSRQQSYITPCIIAPFVDRLISMGVLPKPEDGYSIWWPDLTSQSDQERAAVAATATMALGQYVASGVENLVPPMEYLTKILGWTDEEAASILDSAFEKAREDAASPKTGIGGI